MLFSKPTVGQKLYFSILAVFLAFTAMFLFFQRTREKQFKTETLNIRLQSFNANVYEAIGGRVEEKALNDYLAGHHVSGLRLTVIGKDGKVLYDNVRKDYQHFSNHLGRKEVTEAIMNGQGYEIERNSKTLNVDYFYSATYFRKEGIVIRSALPYNDDLAKSLKTDQHYIWFALSAIIVLTVVLWRFLTRLGDNISKLRTFANRAAHNESLDTEDLAVFPDDELGEIAERIIKIYKNLESTRKEQDVLKRQLTQNIAHELKTPVASIQGYLETIRENSGIDEVTKEQFIDRCYVQTQRLVSLLNDISMLNRIDDALGYMDFENVDLSETVEGIIRQTALQLEAKHMKFINRMPKNIVINGNQSLLYSVFRNLTDNAIAYAGENTCISLECRDGGDRWYFTFSDNGIGVGNEHLARLFERFYRVDKGRSRKMGGTGLGLAIVKNAVLLHGGTISVKNNPEGGLRFDFSLKKYRG